MHEKFFPAAHMGDFDDPHAALHSVGVTGHLADMVISGLDDTPGEVAAYMACLEDSEEDSPSQPMLVIQPLERGRIGLYLGFLGLLADSRDEALILAAEGLIDAALAGEFKEPPVLNAFQWKAPRRILQ